MIIKYREELEGRCATNHAHSAISRERTTFAISK